MTDRAASGSQDPRLAIDGGAPVRQAPFPPWPSFADDEIEAATAVLRSGRVNYWTGPQGRAFEAEFAGFIGMRYGVAVANGTVALQTCLEALGVGPGDEVIVPSRTFVATGTTVCQQGATPVFADVDRESGNVTPATIEPLLSARTRAVVVVHLGGWPADMDGIADLCRRRSVALVEDCAQSHGAQIGNRYAGAFADMSAFSFCQDKILTTGGEGGMVLTSSESLWRRAWSFKDHGKDWRASHASTHPPGFVWLHAQVGTNGRLTEMQAAIGRAQLRKLEAWVERRRYLGQRLAERLDGVLGLRIPAPGPSLRHAMYRFYAYVEPELLREGWTRDRILTAIAAEGIPIHVGSCGEIYREAAFGAQLRPATPRPVAAELFATSLAFRVHPTLEDRDIDDTAAAVTKVFGEAT